jgi:hypothetical protein
MKVKQAVEWLLELDQESEIVIGWWDKHIAENYVDELITDNQWSEIVRIVGDEPIGFQYVGELITDLATDQALAKVQG